MKRLIPLLLLMLLWCVPAHANITYTGAGALGNAITTTDATATMPAGLAEFDIIFIYAWTRSTSNTTVISGYTQVAQVDTTTGDHRLFWKRAGSSEATATCDHDTSADNYCQAFAYRGVVVSGNPWDALGSFQTTGTEPVALTAIVTGAASQMVVMFGGYEDNDTASQVTTGTDPAAYTEVYTESGTGADGAITISYAVRATAGSTGTVTVDFDVALSDQFAGILLSLKPAPWTCTQGGAICTSTTDRQCAAAANNCNITIVSSTSGSVGIACMHEGGSATANFSISSAGGFTFPSSSKRQANGSTTQCGYNLNMTGGVTTIACVSSAGTDTQCFFWEFTTTLSTKTFDVGNSATSASCDPCTGPSLSLTTSNYYIFGGDAGFGNAGVAINQGWTGYVTTNSNFAAMRQNIQAYTAPAWDQSAAGTANISSIAIYTSDPSAVEDDLFWPFKPSNPEGVTSVWGLVIGFLIGGAYVAANCSNGGVSGARVLSGSVPAAQVAYVGVRKTAPKMADLATQALGMGAPKLQSHVLHPSQAVYEADSPSRRGSQ